MLDAIHDRFHALDDLWQTLTGPTPPVSFYLAALSNLALTADEVYIKINARGKLLTDFEHFKARFLEFLEQQDPSRAASMAQKFDNAWLGLFWKSFGRNAPQNSDKAALTDQCFVAFLRYLAEIFLCWPADEGKDGAAALPSARMNTAQDDVYHCLRTALHPEGKQLPQTGNLDFLETLLDALAGYAGGVDGFFTLHFAATGEASQPVEGKINLFASKSNLFERCCTQPQTFFRADKLLLFGCLLALRENLPSATAHLRLRTLRNLLENSANEVRAEFFPQQLGEVHALLLRGELAAASRFNKRQAAEEAAKMKLRAEHAQDTAFLAALDYLEDHPLLRGRLAVFSENDARVHPHVFNRQTVLEGQLFVRLAFGQPPADFDAVLRGLLSQEDYTLHYGPQRRYLGKGGVYTSSTVGLRDIFTTLDQANSIPCRRATQALASRAALCADAGALKTTLHAVADAWLTECNTAKRMDWRYYFVKYACMRPEGHESALYFWGYSAQSFNQLKLSGATRLSVHWSPFLWAAVCEAGYKDDYTGIDSQGQNVQPLLFPWCNLALWWDECAWRIGTPVRNHPLDAAQTTVLGTLRSAFTNVDADGWWPIAGHNAPGDTHRLYDTEDRIALIVPLIQAVYALRPA